MHKLLGINIRQFDEGEQEEDFSQFVVDGELDVESLVNHYQTTEAPETEPETTHSEEVETPNDVEPETVPENADDEPPAAEQEPEKTKNTPDQAFAEMRRQLEANEPLAKWVQDIAQQQGFQDPQELIQAYEQQKVAKEAEAQGVPVDLYQRLHKLEQENKQKEEENRALQFNQEVEAVRAKHSLNDEQLTQVFQFMGQNGYDAGTIPFEHAYMLANSETLIQQAEERGKQSYLEQKQQLQQQATPNIGTNVNDKQNQGLDYSKEAIFAKFAEFGIETD